MFGRFYYAQQNLQLHIVESTTNIKDYLSKNDLSLHAYTIILSTIRFSPLLAPKLQFRVHR